MENRGIATPRIVAAVREVTKAYPGLIACRKVTMELVGGEIHALIGENGAGKSTVVNILGGLTRPERGWVEIDGRPFSFHDPLAAKRIGIGVVRQSGSLIESMTVHENIGLAVQKDSTRRTRSIEVSRWHRRRISELSPRERRLVEIEKGLQAGTRLLVLDEPTTALTPSEAEDLFATLHEIAKSGCAILVVSHKLRELVAHADRFTLMRGGQVVGRLVGGAVSPEELAELMIGNASLDADFLAVTGVASVRSSELDAPEADDRRARAKEGGVMLVRIRNLRAKPPTPSQPQLVIPELIIRRGETVGLVGWRDSGAAGLMDVLYGNQAMVSEGRIEWFDPEGSLARSHPGAVGLLPADRYRGGVVPGFSIATNLALRHRELLDWRQTLFGGGPQPLVKRLMSEMGVQPSDPQLDVMALSGGNLQKVIVARELEFARDLLLATAPTAGLDVATAAHVLRSLRKKASGGASVVIHSDDLDELAGVADRILVFVQGQIVADLSGQQISRQTIGLHLAGLSRAGIVPPAGSAFACHG